MEVEDANFGQGKVGILFFYFYINRWLRSILNRPMTQKDLKGWKWKVGSIKFKFKLHENCKIRFLISSFRKCESGSAEAEGSFQDCMI